MFLIQKYTQYKAAQAEQQKRKVTEKELAQLNHKIDKLLTKLDEHEPELANNQDEECVVCVHAKATMQTYPCGHRVVCRKCFVKTIQMAVAQRLLPLRCVMCRAKILRLKHTSAGGVHASASQYTMSSGQWYHVPQSASLYSVTSSTSGVSGVSSASSCSSASSYKTCASSFSAASLKSKRSYSSYSKMGYQPLRTSSPSPSRSPNARGGSAGAGGGSLMAKKDNKVCPVLDSPISVGGGSIVGPGHQNNGQMPKGKLTLIREFQREYRHGKEQSQNERKCAASNGGSVIGGSSYKPGSTRIKCARLLVSQAQNSCSDIPTPTGTGPSSKATTPTEDGTRTMMRKSESLNGSSIGNGGSGRGISRSSSMAGGAASSSGGMGKKTGSSSQGGGGGNGCGGSSSSAATTPTSSSSQQPPNSQSCPSLRISRRESSTTAIPTTANAASKITTTSTPAQRSRDIRESSSREILSASGLTVRFGGATPASPGIFPSAKSRTPQGAGGGVASIPLLSK